VALRAIRRKLVVATSHGMVVICYMQDQCAYCNRRLVQLASRPVSTSEPAVTLRNSGYESKTESELISLEYPGKWKVNRKSGM
jgi:hypothetical protein